MRILIFLFVSFFLYSPPLYLFFLFFFGFLFFFFSFSTLIFTFGHIARLCSAMGVKDCSINSILVSYGCRNRLPQTWWFTYNNRKLLSHSPGSQKSKKSWQGLIASEGLWGESFLFPLQPLFPCIPWLIEASLQPLLLLLGVLSCLL